MEDEFEEMLIDIVDVGETGVVEQEENEKDEETNKCVRGADIYLEELERFDGPESYKASNI